MDGRTHQATPDKGVDVRWTRPARSTNPLLTLGWVERWARSKLSFIFKKGAEVAALDRCIADRDAWVIGGGLIDDRRAWWGAACLIFIGCKLEARVTPFVPVCLVESLLERFVPGIETSVAQLILCRNILQKKVVRN